MHLRRYTLVALFSLLILSAPTIAAESAAMQEIKAEYGKPLAVAKKGGKIVWVYAKGDVVFEDGEVISASWMSESEFKERLQRRKEYSSAGKPKTVKGWTVGAPASPPASKPRTPQVKKPATTTPVAAPKKFPAYAYHGAVPIIVTNITCRYGNHLDMKDPTLTKAAVGRVKTDMLMFPSEVLERCVRQVNVFYTAHGLASHAGGGKICISSERFQAHEIGKRVFTPFPHEAAHALQTKYVSLFPTKEWTEANARGYLNIQGRGFRGTWGQVENVWSNQIRYIYKDGFIDEYGICNIREDFATLVEQMYCNPKRTFRLADAHPRLKTKEKLATSFLSQAYEKAAGKKIPLDRSHFIAVNEGRLKHTPAH